MKTGKKVANIFFGCAVFLFPNHYALAASMTITSTGIKPPTVTIVSGGALQGKEFSFSLTGSGGNVICKGITKLGIGAPPIVCPNLRNIQQDKLKVTMGPESTTKCKPIMFSYKRGQSVFINPRSLSDCDVLVK